MVQNINYSLEVKKGKERDREASIRKEGWTVSK